MRIFLIILSFFMFFGTSTVSAQQAPQEEKIEAVIIKIVEEKEIQPEGVDKKQLYQKLEMLVTQGKIKGKTIFVNNGDLPSVNVVKYDVGDKLIVTATQNYEGKDVYYITDFIRTTPLYWLFFIFIAITILIGRKRGIASLAGLVISFFIIFSFVLPQILAGHDPILIAIAGSLIIIPVTFYLSHGFNMKTTMAVIGTIVALIITGILANIFVDLTRLSGFASEEAGFLEAVKHGSVSIRGLLLAGIIIGVLGILDDITISQAAIVQQLKEASPKISFTELYSRAMDIGRDHIASMVNTLILVYTGAAMPLLLLFVNTPHPFTDVINYEIIAEEVVRTLVASIGLILAVPITTFLTAYFSKRK